MSRRVAEERVDADSASRWDPGELPGRKSQATVAFLQAAPAWEPYSGTWPELRVPVRVWQQAHEHGGLLFG